MTWQKGQSGNPSGDQKRAKPFRDALLIELASDPLAARKAAKALIERAGKGDVASIREFADRVDGKVAQAIVGDDEHPAVNVNINDEDRLAAIKRLVQSVSKASK